jgi:CRISPR-associated protein Csm3
MKLKGKIVFKGQFKTKTGLHVGGSKSSLAIGGIDNSVIKTAKNRPYIPGSSIKGKLRSLLAKVEGSLFFSQKEQEDEQKRLTEFLKNSKRAVDDTVLDYKTIITDSNRNDEQFPYIMELFGYSGDNENEYQINQTRLLVRDAFLNETEWNREFSRIKDIEYTHSKWENVINRRTGTAEHPRQMERVPAGTYFDFELVYSIYDDVIEKDNTKLNEHIHKLLLALKLLEDDGIGGQLSRGYGQVEVIINDVQVKLIDENYSYQSYTFTEGAHLNEANQDLIAEFIKPNL